MTKSDLMLRCFRAHTLLLSTSPSARFLLCIIINRVLRTNDVTSTELYSNAALNVDESKPNQLGRATCRRRAKWVLFRSQSLRVLHRYEQHSFRYLTHRVSLDGNRELELSPLQNVVREQISKRRGL